MTRPTPSRLIVGLGSPHGDDRIGWAVVDRLLRERPVTLPARRVADGVALLSALEGWDDVVVVDAAAPAGRPGLVRRFRWPCPDLADAAPLSTHGLGLVEALRMAEVLGRLPARVTIYTVEALQAEPGAPLSEAAERALDLVVAMLVRGPDPG